MLDTLLSMSPDGRREAARQLYADLACITELRAAPPKQLEQLISQARRLVTPPELKMLARDMKFDVLQGAAQEYMTDVGWDRWRGGSGPDGWSWRAVQAVPVGDRLLFGTGELLTADEALDLRAYLEAHESENEGSEREHLELQIERHRERLAKDPERTVVLFVLGRMHLEARRLIYRLLKEPGLEIDEPWYWWQGEALRLSVRHGWYERHRWLRDPFVPRLLYEIHREKRVPPFGLCRYCDRVFVQPQRGRPRQYCSKSCAEKGMPCRQQRTEQRQARRRPSSKLPGVGTTQVDGTVAAEATARIDSQPARVRRAQPAQLDGSLSRDAAASSNSSNGGRTGKAPRPVRRRVHRRRRIPRPPRPVA